MKTGVAAWLAKEGSEGEETSGHKTMSEDAAIVSAASAVAAAAIANLEARKGVRIRYLHGKNAKFPRGGWIDKGRTHHREDRIFILVDLGEGMIFPTWALKKNIGPIRSLDDTYWQAVLAGCPDIELKMNTLAMDLAECQLDDFKPAADYMEERFKDSVRIQDALGSKARVRRIKYKGKRGEKRQMTREAARGDHMEEEEEEEQRGSLQSL